MSDEKSGGKASGPVDKELDDLLDSALEDMTKKPEAAAPAQAGDDPVQLALPGSEDPNAPTVWTEDFIKEAAAQFESNMAALLGNISGVPEEQITQDQIAQTFSKMAEAAAQVMQPTFRPDGSAAETEDPPIEMLTADQGGNDVTAAIAQTLQSLNSNTDSLQAPFTDQDLANMFGNFNLDGAQDGNAANMFVPFMQGMMQSLLSKEVLYPSMKDLVDKYPDWLKENKDKVDKADYERYMKQNELMNAVCTELETEQENDSEEVKRKRFETILELMQKMQDLGQPPTELVGDLGMPGAGFAQPPMPAPGQDQAQCSIM